MTRRFLVDAQLPPRLAKQLVEAGYEAIHVVDLGLVDATDLAIWQIATDREMTIISKDEDFVTLCLRTRAGPQLLWLRVGNVGNGPLWVRLSEILPQIIAALDAGERVVEFR